MSLVEALIGLGLFAAAASGIIQLVSSMNHNLSIIQQKAAYQSLIDNAKMAMGTKELCKTSGILDTTNGPLTAPGTIVNKANAGEQVLPDEASALNLGLAIKWTDGNNLMSENSKDPSGIRITKLRFDKIVRDASDPTLYRATLTIAAKRSDKVDLPPRQIKMMLWAPESSGEDVPFVDCAARSGGTTANCPIGKIMMGIDETTGESLCEPETACQVGETVGVIQLTDDDGNPTSPPSYEWGCLPTNLQPKDTDEFIVVCNGVCP